MPKKPGDLLQPRREGRAGLPRPHSSAAVKILRARKAKPMFPGVEWRLRAILVGKLSACSRDVFFRVQGADWGQEQNNPVQAAICLSRGCSQPAKLRPE